MAATTNTVKLCSVSDEVQAEIIIDILKQNGIHAYREGVGSAGVLEIYGSNSTSGENVFVNENDFEKAQELTKQISEVDRNQDIRRKSSKISQAAAIVILVAFVVILVYVFYISV